MPEAERTIIVVGKAPAECERGREAAKPYNLAVT